MIEPGALKGTLRNAYVIWLEIPKEETILYDRMQASMILKCILYIFKFLARLNSYWIGSIGEVLWTDRRFNGRRSDFLPREVIIISRYVIL